MNAATDALQARGIYPLGEAARLAHVRPQTARRWVEGYGYRRGGEPMRSEGVAYLSRRGRRRDDDRAPLLLDFEQLLTLMLVRAFLDRGLSLPKIKAAAARAREQYGMNNPFVTEAFRTDGNRVFVDLDPTAQGREREMIDILSDQRQFRGIVEPSLFRDVVFINRRPGEWWPLGTDRAVVVSPAVQFGAPHLGGTGVRTDVVAQLVDAEGGGEQAVRAAIDWFGLGPEQVRDAIEFEGEWQTRPPA